MKGRRHVPRPASWGRRQGSPQDVEQMPPLLLTCLPGTCLLAERATFPHIASSSFPGTGDQLPLSLELSSSSHFLASPASGCWGGTSSVAQALTSSPPLTGLSRPPHDWQRQAGGGRPAGCRPAPGLTQICWRRHTKGLAEKSLTGGTGLLLPPN